MKRGFTLLELLIATTIILMLGIGLARGILEMIQLNMKIQARQRAVEVVQSWASYIESLPFDSWIINPRMGDPNDPPGVGSNALYCFDCAFNRAFCDTERRQWDNPTAGATPTCTGGGTPSCPTLSCTSGHAICPTGGMPFCDGATPRCILYPSCTNPNDPNCTYCNFMAPGFRTPWGPTRIFDSDNDNIVALLDPYHGPNNCKNASVDCTLDENRKYRNASHSLAGHLRIKPVWGGSGGNNCACRLGNCSADARTGTQWGSDDAGSRPDETNLPCYNSSDPTTANNSCNYEINPNRLGNMRCTYQIFRTEPQGQVGRGQGSYSNIYVGLTVINYFNPNNPITPAGKAIGIVAWYFDPVDREYRSANTVVFKEAP